MAFKDDYEFDLLINEAENLVIEELEEQLSDEKFDDICKCQDCVLDMATFALNQIPPKYRSSYIGIIYAQQYQSGEYRELIKQSVKTAIDKISSNPSHE